MAAPAGKQPLDAAVGERARMGNGCVRASDLRAVQLVKRCTINRESGEFLDHTAHLNRSRNHASAMRAHAPEIVGRFLLVFAAVELISMPFTQYAWTWDHFLRGGTDFESSLLFLVICLGLLLVLRHHYRQGENLCVPRWRLSLPIFDIDKSAATFGTGVLLQFHPERRASSNLATCNLPLQI